MSTAPLLKPTLDARTSVGWLRRFARTTPGVVGLIAVTDADAMAAAAAKVLTLSEVEHPNGVRMGMERCCRELARESSGMGERIELAEKANAIRPRTRV